MPAESVAPNGVVRLNQLSGADSLGGANTNKLLTQTERQTFDLLVAYDKDLRTERLQA